MLENADRNTSDNTYHPDTEVAFSSPPTMTDKRRVVMVWISSCTVVFPGVFATGAASPPEGVFVCLCLVAKTAAHTTAITTTRATAARMA